MASERQNMWKVLESDDIFNAISKMNELERLYRLEHTASKTDDEFDFLLDVVSIAPFKSKC